MAACRGCASPTPPSPPTYIDSPVEAVSDETPTWLIVAAIGVVVGLSGFFVVPGDGVDGDESAVSPEPPATVMTTVPTIAGSVVGTLAVDEPVVVDGHPIGLVAVGDTVLAFVAAEAPARDGVEPADVSVWELDAEGEWLERGVVLTGVFVSEVVAEPDGLVAVGVDADGRPTAWRSVDGVDWSAQRLHEGTDREIPFTVTAVDGLTVVAARPIASAPETAAVWDDRGTGWRLERLERSVDELHPGPPGEILVSTSGASGPAIARFDGVTWLETSLGDTGSIERWRDGFIARGPEHELRVIGADLELQADLVVPGPEERQVTHLAATDDTLAVAMRRPADEGGRPAGVSIASTRDGVSWHEAHLPIRDAEVFPERIEVAGDRIVVASVVSGADADDVRTLLTTVRPETIG